MTNVFLKKALHINSVILDENAFALKIIKTFRPFPSVIVADWEGVLLFLNKLNVPIAFGWLRVVKWTHFKSNLVYCCKSCRLKLPVEAILGLFHWVRWSISINRFNNRAI
jgi:hypothetical protein